MGVCFKPEIMSKERLSKEAENSLPMQTEAAPAIDMRRPETSAILQSILKDSKSEDSRTRFSAMQRFNDAFFDLTHSSGKDTECTADAFSFLLERGFMTPIAEDLEAAAAGSDWLLLSPCDCNTLKTLEALTRARTIECLNKPAILADAVEYLAVDRRTVSYMLKTMPNLPSLLKQILLVEPTYKPEELAIQLPQQSPSQVNIVRAAVMRTLVHLAAFSAAINKEIGKSRQLLSKIMRRALSASEDEKLVGSSIVLFSTVLSHVDLLALETDILHLTARILADSQSQVQISAAAGCIEGVLEARGPLRPLPQIAALKSAAYAMFLCENLMPDLQSVPIVMAFDITEGEIIHTMGDEIDLSQAIKLLAEQDPTARKRAEELKAIFSKEERVRGIVTSLEFGH